MLFNYSPSPLTNTAAFNSFINNNSTANANNPVNNTNSTSTTNSFALPPPMDSPSNAPSLDKFARRNSSGNILSSAGLHNILQAATTNNRINNNNDSKARTVSPNTLPELKKSYSFSPSPIPVSSSAGNFSSSSANSSQVMSILNSMKQNAINKSSNLYSPALTSSLSVGVKRDEVNNLTQPTPMTLTPTPSAVTNSANNPITATASTNHLQADSVNLDVHSYIVELLSSLLSHQQQSLSQFSKFVFVDELKEDQPQQQQQCNDSKLNEKLASLQAWTNNFKRELELSQHKLLEINCMVEKIGNSIVQPMLANNNDSPNLKPLNTTNNATNIESKAFPSYNNAAQSNNVNTNTALAASSGVISNYAAHMFASPPAQSPFSTKLFPNTPNLTAANYFPALSPMFSPAIASMPINLSPRHLPLNTPNFIPQNANNNNINTQFPSNTNNLSNTISNPNLANASNSSVNANNGNSSSSNPTNSNLSSEPSNSSSTSNKSLYHPQMLSKDDLSSVTSTKQRGRGRLDKCSKHRKWKKKCPQDCAERIKENQQLFGSDFNPNSYANILNTSIDSDEEENSAEKSSNAATHKRKRRASLSLPSPAAAPSIHPLAIPQGFDYTVNAAPLLFNQYSSMGLHRVLNGAAAGQFSASPQFGVYSNTYADPYAHLLVANRNNKNSPYLMK
jgi:hypothetical protein